MGLISMLSCTKSLMPLNFVLSLIDTVAKQNYNIKTVSIYIVEYNCAISLVCAKRKKIDS